MSTIYRWHIRHVKKYINVINGIFVFCNRVGIFGTEWVSEQFLKGTSAQKEKIASHHQFLSVTTLPQLAGCANYYGRPA